uniref:Uncharacterized protein n=1 Tax=Trieres chinensis TaxID=1514140 RepID=A0A7S2A9F3_TRICV|mmetsp:Transcript_8281/g.17538  ORF Transcript_8281/g.17538 Transcript_8281/m.17538 type:complete len:114 (+) Transcript_8281:84-425(+)|eukprot:CAMPEP_0183298108 /NCGR_PEP_ID=MMETSP0160_2-20130417/5227_1 /TAXON_ID=2839 ORGANISM="Odontella Sinensis, Strain Grunow 1884" /NCGR_SAMPLE_ID=MMETSP0160_2 /ASSEMBLY_ACC=CAM_ASM_000250 /LENGTH=113 /DNA_ID=CAMNT_0025460069 /DNA_START=47 /DNA_END=388 /DNA_ORIENTATION=-
MALEPDQVDDSHTPPSIVSDSAVEQNVEVTNSGLRKRRSSPSLSGGGGQTGKHYWGGSLIETAKEHDGLVSKIGSDFAAETTCHGINQIFNRESGWLRSIFYAFALVMIGTCA